MAEHIATIGKEIKGRYPKVTASVSNFVPKAHTPYQWNGMQRREYFQAHSTWGQAKDGPLTSSPDLRRDQLVEGVLSRGDRRTDGHRTGLAAGARMDG